MAFVSIKPMADKITCKGGESTDCVFDLINTSDTALRIGVRATGPLKDKKWVELAGPAEVELPPKGQQKIKFTIKLPAEATPTGSEPAKAVFKGQVYDLNNPEITAEAAVTVETPAVGKKPDGTVPITPGKKPNWALIIGGIVGGFVVLCGIGVAVWMLLQGPEMPDVVGLTAVDAQTKLDKAKVEAEFTEEFTGTEAAGTVIRQTPDPGEAIPENETASIVIELVSVAVPQVIGLGVPAAEEEINGAGFVLGETQYEITGRSPGGTVIAQRPSPGVPSIPGADVTLTVEKAMVPVPNIVGVRYVQATKRLADVGLLEGKTVNGNKRGAQAGTVLTQIPKAGKSVEKGSAVNLTLQEKFIKVPRVVGLQLDLAKKRIKAAGLQPRPITQYQKTTTPGKVVAQDPSPNVDKRQGSDVVVVVEQNPVHVVKPLIFHKNLVMKQNVQILQKARSAPPAQSLEDSR